MTGLGIPSAWHSMTTFCPGLTRITESDSFPLKNSLWPVTSAVRHNELRRKAAANGWVWRPIWQIDDALAKSGEKAVGNFAFKVDFLWRPPFVVSIHPLLWILLLVQFYPPDFKLIGLHVVLIRSQQIGLLGLCLYEGFVCVCYSWLTMAILSSNDIAQLDQKKLKLFRE